MRKCLLLLVFLGGCPWDPDPQPPKPPVLVTEARVDLRARQTAIRNQGGRTTCITFAALAGVEAAHKRMADEDVDLSEEFLNHVGKMSWLHPNWNSSSIPEPRLGSKPAYFLENQIGAFGGGGGPGYVRALSRDLRVVDEAVLPYRPSGVSTAEFPELTHLWFEPFWLHQLTSNDFNLHPTALPVSAILAPRSFGVAAWHNVNANSAAAIEAELTNGREVVWDGIIEGTQSPIWRTCREAQPCAVQGGHSMLIVGYDRTAADPAQHYFIVKNSWGQTDIAGAYGFTYMSYDYLKNGYDALAIDRLQTNEAWTSLRFIGRWQPVWNGPAAIIDLYHVPGSAQGVLDAYGAGIADKRFGGMYAASGTAWRVNGSISGNTATLYFDETRPNLRWDALSGSRLDLTLSADGTTMTGTYLKAGLTTGSSVTLTRVSEPAQFRALSASIPRPTPAARDEAPIFPFALP
jgi:hypothetical protein